MLLPGLGTLRSCARPIPSGHREDLRKCKHGCTMNYQVLRRIPGSASLISLHASRYFAAALSESQPTSQLYASLAFSRADCSADIHGVLTLVIVWWMRRGNLPGVVETPLPSFFNCKLLCRTPICFKFRRRSFTKLVHLHNGQRRSLQPLLWSRNEKGALFQS